MAVEAAPVAATKIPIIANVTAKPMRTPQEIRSDLQAQLTSRVRWTESIQEMVQQGVTTIVELGSGSVLCGLIKRIDRQVKCLSLRSPADFDALSQIE